MPLEVERLTTESSMKSTREAISASIAKCMSEPTPEGTEVKDKQAWCAAKAYAIARESTGQELAEGTIR